MQFDPFGFPYFTSQRQRLCDRRSGLCATHVLTTGAMEEVLQFHEMGIDDRLLKVIEPLLLFVLDHNRSPVELSIFLCALVAHKW